MSTAVNQTPLPTRHLLRRLIEDYVDTEVMIGDGVAAPARTTNIVGVYVTQRLATSALVITDFEAAARLSGAIARIPRVVVQEAISARTLTPVMNRTFYTLLDHLSQLFVAEGAPEINLYEMYEPNSVIPADVAALAGQAGRRIDLRLGIDGYGPGQLSVIVH